MTTHINVLLFPNVTQLDFTGPAQVFSRMPGTTVDLVAGSGEPVVTDCGWSVLPTVTLAQAPPADVLFVPGGQGTFEAFLDPDVVGFVADQAADATWVTSVCTGSFLLAAAGLLTGRRATSHWASVAMLERFGAVPTRERVVTDGNVITGAGVTSGIDFALTLAARIHGVETAQRIQLQLEYDPDPPYATGSPAAAPSEWVERGLRDAEKGRAGAVETAARRLKR
ncbi:DJ-1/PfpI family protein [Spiractinospora alimapuensis]|uniref:DJ-1/PfpI family protein n=1 Tax=Spiractinospora alimapuensis TaxID=2820884 RepID=UPI001F1DF7CF|nr:DJ-1/PfpI family protein [Spiractinospora alimapuensis]QVQ52463.1 DJ-1/PfpI family protein [Spiractinospora alimapuensis]